MLRSKELKKDIADMKRELERITKEMDEVHPRDLDVDGSYFHLSLHHHELCIAIMRDESFLGEVV